MTNAELVLVLMGNRCWSAGNVCQSAKDNGVASTMGRWANAELIAKPDGARSPRTEGDLRCQEFGGRDSEQERDVQKDGRRNCEMGVRGTDIYAETGQSAGIGTKTRAGESGQDRCRALGFFLVPLPAKRPYHLPIRRARVCPSARQRWWLSSYEVDQQLLLSV